MIAYGPRKTGGGAQLNTVAGKLRFDFCVRALGVIVTLFKPENRSLPHFLFGGIAILFHIRPISRKRSKKVASLRFFGKSFLDIGRKLKKKGQTSARLFANLTSEQKKNQFRPPNFQQSDISERGSMCPDIVSESGFRVGLSQPRYAPLISPFFARVC